MGLPGASAQVLLLESRGRFTGRLVSAYLSSHSSARWAVAGRTASKLEELCHGLSGSSNPPASIVVAESGDGETVASSARVVLSTAGPFSLHSDAIVKACAESGTSYVDINGEVPWVKRVIERDASVARRTGAVIVPNCGFDSVPSDLGVLLATDGQYEGDLEGHMKMQGVMSGGTIATGILMATTYADELKQPFLLGGQPSSFDHSDPVAPVAPTDARSYWLAPFTMAPINTRVVRRSAFLAGAGAFRYREFVVAPSETVAAKIAKNYAVPPDKLQGLVDAGRLPRPSQGPDEATRATSWFQLDVVDANDNKVLATVKGGDPGYDETAKMVSVAAIALATDDPAELGCRGQGGVWTPASGIGRPLVTRLNAAHMSFERFA